MVSIVSPRQSPGADDSDGQGDDSGALPGGVGSGDRTGVCQDTGAGGLGHGHTLEDTRPGRLTTTRFTYGAIAVMKPAQLT